MIKHRTKPAVWESCVWMVIWKLDLSYCFDILTNRHLVFSTRFIHTSKTHNEKQFLFRSKSWLFIFQLFSRGLFDWTLCLGRIHLESPNVSCLNKRSDSHFVVGIILIDQRRLNKRCNFLRRFGWEENFLNNGGHNTRVLLIYLAADWVHVCF